MATSSRQSSLFGVQDWKRIYQTYREADFQSYDYETLRKSFIDYLTQTYPETFNDYIESSEFVAILDVIAFMGQALAFRNDLNTRENFIDTAERRDSVIKLANLVGYTPKRNSTAQGLLKVTSISTTENVTDINGANLSNKVIIWNDAGNSLWQEQFNSILNASLVNSQRIGKSGNSQVISGVKTDEYAINIPNDKIPTISFSSEVDGSLMPFELVNVTSADKEYLYEMAPTPSSQFNILYRNDKLGYGSIDTGFFFYFKQGSLQEVKFTFPEQIQNNFELINIQNINNDDTWLYQLDSNGLPLYLWKQIENIYANNTSQNTKKVYSVLSRTNDQVTYVFGDGVFGEIPIGNFKAYVRSGNALEYTISPEEISGVSVRIDYVSRTNRLETLTFTLSLQTTVSNALQRETLSQIKERAPSRYYTQNRMVNGEDYSNFPFTTFSSIVKSKAVNRTSIGISRSQDLIDPTGKYSSLDVYSDDGALYDDDTNFKVSFSAQSLNTITDFLSASLPVYMSSTEVLQYFYKNFPRFTGKYTESTSRDNKCYWKRITLGSTQVTGYFYIIDSNNKEVPIPIGQVSTVSTKYISKGSLVKFVAPQGKYFDQTNHLITGTINQTNMGKQYIWVRVDAVVGDGCNNGLGVLVTGDGPVVLGDYVPSGVSIDDSAMYNTSVEPDKYIGSGVVSSFTNQLPQTLVSNLISFAQLKTANFRLVYNNTNVINPWTIIRDNNDSTETIVSFTYVPTEDSYSVEIKNKTYYFGSTKQVKFFFDTSKKIFDPKNGTVLSDIITINKSNSNVDYPTYSSTYATLQRDYKLSIYSQKIRTDGSFDDFAVKVSVIDELSKSVYEPDFFDKIVGSDPGYVYFGDPDSSDTIIETGILPVENIIHAYATKNSILEVMYEYPVGTVFHATSENKFYTTSVEPLTKPTVLNLSDVTSNYSFEVGRNNISFQYKKNSSNTTRVNPCSTNIIDLYLVTQSYHTQYKNWINDVTGTIVEPMKPSITELSQTYSNLENFKMISDNIVLNSVTFKPLFGSKAEYSLQGTIKVVKNPATVVSDSQIKASVLSAMNSYFTIDKWDFGDTFYFSELSAYLHVRLAGLISSVVIVPNDPDKTFGDLYEVRCAPNEIFVNGASINDIAVINSLTSRNLQQR
jgi:hypothetical protein